MMPLPDPHYRHRFPAEIISHAVRLYHVFSLSLRDVELIWLNVVSSSPTRRCGEHAKSWGPVVVRYSRVLRAGGGTMAKLVWRVKLFAA
jgi:hypothetical protein